MMILIYIIASVYIAIFLFELILIGRFRVTQFSHSVEPADWPKATLLVCARNEEHNLPRCIESLIALDYPKDKLLILIGDDNSEDATWSVIEQFQSSHPYIKGVKIQHEKEGLIAKGNVLNQLIDCSTDEYQVIIDADMEVTNHWLKSMILGLQESAMVSGYTQIAQGGRYSHLQFFDWRIVLHTMRAMADTFRPISILGNNMGFRKSAYDQVGGFRALGPTDVEDLGLLQRFQKAGLKTSQLVVSKGMACTQPQQTFSEMITQRCRWMNGVFTHHWVLGIPALFARLWIVFAIVAYFFHPGLCAGIVLYGWLINLFKYVQVGMKTKTGLKTILLEPFFISLLDTFALLRIIFKGKVSWKGRRY